MNVRDIRDKNVISCPKGLTTFLTVLALGRVLFTSPPLGRVPDS